MHCPHITWNLSFFPLEEPCTYLGDDISTKSTIHMSNAASTCKTILESRRALKQVLYGFNVF